MGQPNQTPPILWRSVKTLLSLAAGLLQPLLPGPAAAKAPSCAPDALGVSRTLYLGTEGGWRAGLKTYPQTLALEDHEVILTFDDGPVNPATGKILDALAAECVKATFFLVGRNAEASPALVKREIAEGHTVAHHSYSHPGATLRRLSRTAALAEMVKGFKAVDKAGYGEAGATPKTPFFRFPGFADSPETLAWLSQNNIAVLGTDLWASDWQPMTPQAELELVLNRLDKEKRGILLFHDTKAQTAAMLPALLRELKQRGYKIVHIAPGHEPPPLRAAPPGWTSETDKIIADVFAKEYGARPGKRPALAPAPMGAH